MRTLITIFILFSLSSCSSLKKTLVYSALAGGMTGAAAGVLLSPDKESQGANAAVFGLIGAGVLTLGGYALYQDDPRNYPLNQMLMEKPQTKREPLDPNQLELGLGPIKIDANLDKSEAYQVPVTDLPDALKGKVGKQYLIKYESKERYIKQSGKTFYVPSFNVYEHSYGEGAGSIKTEEEHD